jgi:hypothetical protein
LDKKGEKMTNENTVALESNNEEETNQDIIELDWEEIQDVFAAREELAGLHGYLSNMMLQFEKTKKSLVERAIEMETDLYKRATEIKDSKNVGDDLTYELKLPNKAEEKGYLIKK